MTPQDRPEAADALAAEYVLGTLRGPARRRFERWLGSSPLVQERCRFWEYHLVSLARGLRPVRPPDHVWQGVRARLNLSSPQQHRRRATPVWALAVAVVLVAVLAVVFYRGDLTSGKVSEVAEIATPQGVRYWTVDVYERSARLVVHAGTLPGRPGDHDYELWALPKDGKPVSLGVLPIDGTTRQALSTSQQQALQASEQLAVTVEAMGGSPSGQPTGKPLYVAPLRKAS